MNRRFIHFLSLLLVLGICSTAVYAQRGFGGRGFGGGRGVGRTGPVFAPGSRGGSVPRDFRSAPNGRFINNLRLRGIFIPVTEKGGNRFFPFVHRRVPFSFFRTGARFPIFGVESGLGTGIPPLATPLPQAGSFFLGVRLVETAHPIRTIIDLPPFGHGSSVRLGDLKTSSTAIISLPTNIFDRADNRRPSGSVPK